MCLVPAVAGIAPNRLLVVYQTNSPDKDLNGVGDSLQLASYYILKRGVPASNMLGVTTTVLYNKYAEADYSKFQNEIVKPIKAKLAVLGPLNIDVILMIGSFPEFVTRTGGQAISLDSALMALNYWKPSSIVGGVETGNNLMTLPNPYGANAVALKPSVGPDAPRFSHSFQVAGTTMYLVTRLGGGDALRGIKQLSANIFAESHLPTEVATYGVGYVDTTLTIPVGDPAVGMRYTDAWLVKNVPLRDPNFTTYTNADIWIAYGEHFIAAAGMQLRWENTAGGVEIGEPTAKWSDGTPALLAPRAFLYGGWYNFDKYNDVWDWLPGSIACDLNSAPMFAKAALAHGASNAAYVISEPGLAGHQRPDTLLYYILKGYTFAEATALSTPSIGWMNANDGDPLYAPMEAGHPAPPPASCFIQVDGRPVSCTVSIR